MPFSSVLGASSVIKPGVCTSTTRPTVPYEGQLIYETDTDRVASYNGSAWVYTATSGLVLVKTQTVGTAVSSVTVTDAFSATYDSYKILASGIVASGSVDLWMTLGSTSTGYQSSLFYTVYNNTAAAVGSSNGVRFPYIGATAVTSPQLSFEIHSPFLSDRTSFAAMIVSDGYAGSSSGYLNNTLSYTSFNILPSSGTLTGGTIRVYGYAKS